MIGQDIYPGLSAEDNLRFRHYGPMAQAFYRAFGNDGFGTVGNETTICTSDMAGINMMAIQELDKRSAVDRIKISELEKTNEQLRSELAQLKVIVTNLCEKIGHEEIQVSSADLR